MHVMLKNRLVEPLIQLPDVSLGAMRGQVHARPPALHDASERPPRTV